MPTLSKPRFRKIRGTRLNEYASARYGSYKSFDDRLSRIAKLGRTFLDMLREPGLCGGIHHVLDVFEELATDYLDLVVNEIERHGNNIEKVRAGYILSERLGIQDERVEGWKRFAARGGSRKLDPNADYDGLNYSEAWSLSLNV